MELEALGVRRVLNMAENCDDELVIARWGHQAYLKVGLRDHVDQDLKEGLASAIKFIGMLLCCCLLYLLTLNWRFCIAKDN